MMLQVLSIMYARDRCSVLCMPETGMPGLPPKHLERQASSFGCLAPDTTLYSGEGA